MMVAIAAHRNQKSAVGAITLLTAGFCSSGILGIEGVWTKLKYQSRPIHITPAVTCSQRIANSHQPSWPIWIHRPVYAPARRITTIRRPTPAVTVRESDEKKAPMV